MDLPAIGDLGKDNINLKTTKESLELSVENYDGKNYKFSVDKLHSAIDSEASSYILKKDKIVIKLVKKTNSPWSKLEYDEKADFKKEKDKKEDPQQGLMKMMQKMYEEGDDNMKKTIAEAFTKAREGKN